MNVLVGGRVFTVEPGVTIRELSEMVGKAVGYDSGNTCLEISGTALAPGAVLADYLPDASQEVIVMSVHNAPPLCCHSSPYDPATGTYLCGKC
ncbi:MAG TPA: hypothetical protein PKM25_13925 [Candidatus Ozemobacteraceae bacterium]|nr:hypothetical protein [Candidatus Ozemobacteraceae bacterium]